MLELWFKYLAISKASLRGQNLLVSHFSRVLKSSVATGKMTGNSAWTKKKTTIQQNPFLKDIPYIPNKTWFFLTKSYTPEKRDSSQIQGLINLSYLERLFLNYFEQMTICTKDIFA